MKKDISIYLKDIFENMELTETFIHKMSYDDFVNDKKTYYAVIRCIEIIGEAVKQIPDSVKKSISRNSVERDGWYARYR